MLWDYCCCFFFFVGIVLQEWDFVFGKFVGLCKNIYWGIEFVLVEGFYFYKWNGWYYFLIVEGGIGYDYVVIFVCFRDIWGFYEIYLDKYIFFFKDYFYVVLQCVGYGDIVDIFDGKIYFVYFVGCLIIQRRRCVFGCEIVIQECFWKDDWFFVKDGFVFFFYVEFFVVWDEDWYWEMKKYLFDVGEGLYKDFQWFCIFEMERIFNLDSNKFNLIGRESIGFWFE